MTTSPQRPLRFGIYYDGGWFTQLWRHMAGHSPWKAGLNFGGVHDLMRWHLHRQYNHPLASVVLAETHYVLGRLPEKADAQTDDSGWVGTPWGSSPMWDRILKEEGIVRHDTAMTATSKAGKSHAQIGTDVKLALVTHITATSAKLDIVVLIAPYAHFVPLVWHLHQAGIQVVVPSIYERYSTDTGHRVELITEPALIQAADHTPTWTDLITAGLQNDYRLTYPFVAKAGGGPNIGTARPELGFRYGTVNRWDSGSHFGFITENDGTRWFVKVGEVKGGFPLRKGQPVQFRGEPYPAPGRDYPRVRICWAYDVDA
ncbi:hypothetical protein [Nonomuraea sp. NEAU-A123]|uniref:hypothetical protein n=1 Tax=Nonomuraea sp. NEAU-A123 TaxID=2839649 RepID=UPI001BE40132|nr:hypothetical protein [Nonomuraea sp. NEAU-A123]MBT2234733.1 hypothetical protein [Nonomuraea sp. NEAU-A123]